MNIRLVLVFFIILFLFVQCNKMNTTSYVYKYNSSNNVACSMTCDKMLNRLECKYSEAKYIDEQTIENNTISFQRYCRCEVLC